MSIFEGTYKSLLEGVSQQTPQERRQGQLGSQVNMLSDKVTGLRRRGGIKMHKLIKRSPSCYFKIATLGGEPYLVSIDTTAGNVQVQHFNQGKVYSFKNEYFKAKDKTRIRTTTSRDNFFIVNTDLVPEKVLKPNDAGMNPAHYGYFSIRGSQFSKKYTLEITYKAFGTKTYTVTTSANDANGASPEWVSTELKKAIANDGSVNKIIKTHIKGATVAIEVIDKTGTDVLDVQSSSTSGGFIMLSGSSRVTTKSELLGVLPEILDGYIMSVGNTGNTVYYKYSASSKKWSEVGVFEKPYTIKNEPFYFFVDNEANDIKFKPLGMLPRMAGDDDNNPEPSFLEYGITGIGAYQSRLVLLSGAYVHLSKTNTFNQFMRTSVAELLDDDAIEVSSAALSSAQFEYCIPYNKDLVLISQNQQAVMPANNTVLTPKTAVVYPSTNLDLSLSVEPTSVGRTMYYAYQRGVDYYQVGEFIPNTYTDAQYYSQNLTDHIPLYAKGVCTTMSASSTNNMTVFGSDTDEVVVNQFMWAGEERVQMAFHKWKYPFKVMYAQFLQEYLITFMDKGDGTVIIGTQNVQLNQLRTKPVPYLDIYEYVEVVNGKGKIPNDFYKDTTHKVIGVIYSSATRRHKFVEMTINADGTVDCPYEGTIAIGIPYTSEFTLTPPFMKDDNDNVIAGANSTVQSFRMTFENTGQFNVSVKDTMGSAYDAAETTATTWSESELGYSWVNSVGAVTIPCRTILSSTECSVYTDGGTDLNLISAEYTLRVATKRRRI